ncbi:MAG TPA: PPC domain-containing protein, partial [Steroidobacteraceae bacterium]|nr:PPC domain-containing protein [Steroidobacteraceae bacterium]
PVTPLAGASGSDQFFKIDVPAGAQLTVRLSGGSGDADMYVRFGSRPTLTTYQCRPYLNGNNETCAINATSAGTYYVLLHGYAEYSNASLVASYSSQTPPRDPVLENGVPVTGISGAKGSTQYWRITPGAGKVLNVTISGGSGDADLYVRLGSRPTTSSFLCRPYLNGNNEACTIPNTATGDYYIMLRAYTTYSGVTLRGSF